MANNESSAAISVNNVHKNFKLPHEKVNSIKSFVVQGLKKKNKGYEVQHALNGVSFEVNKGEFFGILGRNGSGKSTMLKMLAGIYQPTSGAINTEGKVVPFIELGVGFNPELSGRENVYLNGALLGFTRSEIDAMYDDIVEFAELERFMDQKLKNYSSGMQVRLAFSVATRAKADVLIVDEVLAVGDADFQKKCFNFFKNLKRTGTTVVFVTHDMSAVREYCDRAILIEKGVITHEGSAASVADEYTKLFISNEEDKQEDKTRFGTGEVVFNNIQRDYTKENLIIEFDLVNTTDKIQEGINIGFDFYIENDIITGNGTKYIDSYNNAVTLHSQETKHFKAIFKNIFGNFEFAVNMNIRSQGGLNICDEMKPAFRFQSNNSHLSRFFKVILPVELRETQSNK